MCCDKLREEESQGEEYIKGAFAERIGSVERRWMYPYCMLDTTIHDKLVCLLGSKALNGKADVYTRT